MLGRWRGDFQYVERRLIVGSAWRKTIAVLEIIGGVTGLGSVAVVASQRQPVWPEVGLGAALLGIFSLSLVAGILLWRDTRTGRLASMIVQLIQLPKLLTGKL